MQGTSIELPERLGRRMSLGPFEDVRDLLRFLLIASCGFLPAELWGPWAWLPFVAAGAVLTLIRSEEESLWVLMHRRLAFSLRARSGPVPTGLVDPLEGGALTPTSNGLFPKARGLAPRPGAPPAREGFRDWQIFEHDPWPISGREPEELLRQSSALVRTLSGVAGEVYLVRAPSAWSAVPFLPPARSEESAEETRLRQSYASLLRSSVAGKVRADLFLAIPRSRPKEDPGPRGFTDPREGLESMGWVLRTQGPSPRAPLREGGKGRSRPDRPRAIDTRSRRGPPRTLSRSRPAVGSGAFP